MLEESIGLKIALAGINRIIGYLFENYLNRKKTEIAIQKSAEDISRRNFDLTGEDRELFEALFSKENIEILSNKIGKDNGYYIIENMRKELKKCYSDIDSENTNIEEHIEEFIEYFIENIKHIKPEIYSQIFEKYMLQKSDETVEHVKKLDRNIINIKADNAEISAKVTEIKEILVGLEDYGKTIEEYEQELVASGQYRIDLNFFDYDDREVDDKIIDSIENNVVTIVRAKYDEEALYYVLRLLKNERKDNVYVVDNPEKWGRFIEECNNKILIPNFHGNYNVNCAGNKIIKILFEDEVSSSDNVITLPQRTLYSTWVKLHEYIHDNEKINHIIKQSLGDFSALKYELLDNKTLTPVWSKGPKDLFIKAMFLHCWKETDGDKKIVELVTGVKYDEFITRLAKYTNTQNPFIVKYFCDNAVKYEVVEYDMVWDILAPYVNQKLIGKFVEQISKVIYDEDAVNLCRHIEVEDIGKYSDTLKLGMMDTLTHMRNRFSFSSNLMFCPDAIIKSILEKINTENDWRYICEYLPKLAMSSPKEVFGKINDMVVQKDMNFFKIYGYIPQNPMYRVTKKYILEAIDKIMHEDNFLGSSTLMLAKMAAYEIENNSRSNDALEMLAKFFLENKHYSSVTIEQRKNILSGCCRNKIVAWPLIKMILPDNLHKIPLISSDKIKYINLYSRDEEERLWQEKLLNEYFTIAKYMAGDNLEKIAYLLFKTSYLYTYGLHNIENKMQRLLPDTNISDEEKFKFEYNLREFVYLNKLYPRQKLYPEDVINKIGDFGGLIVYKNLLFKKLYIFLDSRLYELNPKDEYKDWEKRNETKNKLQIDILNTNKNLHLFNLDDLISLCKDDSEIGINIAKVESNKYYSYHIVKHMYDCRKLCLLKGYIYEIYQNTKFDVFKDFVKSIEIKEIRIAVLTAVEGNSQIMEFVENSLDEEDYLMAVESMSEELSIEYKSKVVDICIKQGKYIKALNFLVDQKYPIGVYINALINIQKCILQDNISDIVRQFDSFDYLINEVFKNVYEYDFQENEKLLISNLELFYIGLSDSKYRQFRGRYIYDIFRKYPGKCAEKMIYLDSINYGSGSEIFDILLQFDMFYKIKIDTIDFVKWCVEFLNYFKKQNMIDEGEEYLCILLANFPTDYIVENPSEKVCKVIEECGSDTLINKLVYEIMEKKGVLVGPLGGTIENIVNRYTEIAKNLDGIYPSAAKVFYMISEKYGDLSNRMKEKAIRKI